MALRPAALPPLDPPLVAILRGLPAEDAASVGAALFEAGFQAVEVPLNRPGALRAIATLAALAPAGALIGAGTVMSPQEVQAVSEAGGRLIVCPHCDPAVIDEAVALGLWCVPGVGTASEAFTALRHGAHGLKLFPAEVWGPRGLKALKAVLPEGTPLWPVGGVAADNLAAGFASAAFVAFLSSLTNVSFTAVQYAIFSSLMTLLPKTLGGYSGAMVDALGYPAFFVLTTVLGLPVLLLVIWASRRLQVRSAQAA
jgi:2-dehydro-3-deoxyphosphogalactonate aldolase